MQAALLAPEGPELVTQAEFARRINRSAALVCKWVKLGKIGPASRAPDGRLYFDRALREVRQSYDPSKSRLEDAPLPPAGASQAGPVVVADPEDAGTLAAAKRRREQAQAELAELQLAERRKELVPVAEVQAAGADIAEAVRQALAERVDRLARTVKGLVTADELIRAIGADDRLVMEAIARAVAGRAEQLGSGVA